MLSTTFRAGAYSAAVPAFRELAGRAAQRAQPSGAAAPVAGAAQVGAELRPGQLSAAGSQQPGTWQSGTVQPTAAGGQRLVGQPAAAGADERLPDEPKAPGDREAQPGEPKAAGAGEKPKSGGPGEPRDAKEAEVIRQLAARDAEVRAHEAAHAAAGGAYAGSPSFGFQRGPDGKNYAVSGEVPIDISAIPGDPAATIAKMQQVKQAALAPASPSGADRSIAANADAAMAAARAELFTTGGKDASKPGSADKTSGEASGSADNADSRAAAALPAGRDESGSARQAESLPAGEVARDLFGVLANRSAGVSAYKTSSARGF